LPPSPHVDVTSVRRFADERRPESRRYETPPLILQRTLTARERPPLAQELFLRLSVGFGCLPEQPSDFTDAQWDYGSSDEDLSSVIHDGTSSDMDGYTERLTDTDIWNVVNYIRTFETRP
jgi:hypothetical protein